MADTKIPPSSQQALDAQHLDNMTSLQQPSAAEQSPISHSAEARGDAPVTNSPTPSPDSPSLFNEPKNPNNKVVEVESQENADDARLESSDTNPRNIAGTQELSPANADNANTNFVIQGNAAVGEALAAADAQSTSVVQGASNAERPIVTPVGRVPAAAVSATTQSSTSTSPTSSSNASPPSTEGATTGDVSQPSSSNTQPSFSTLVTPIPVTNETSVPAIASNSAPVISSAATASTAENGLVAYTATVSDVDGDTSFTYALGGTDASLF
ncbi:MAG: hypothetical protein Q7K13_05545, partial [Polynucleobacter sp.]|uniref:hypothetical protein n=1 Tax=Polynucleobacter sp. TaxID=2029855 RepID=UPI002728E99B